MKVVELNEKKLKEYLAEFYSCFKTGYDFETFLKVYLSKIGLDEIQITKRSKDGGVDLVAVRNGIGKFSNADSVYYYIQAKRYKNNKVNVKTLRELKGVIPFGHKGMLITTSEFTQDAINESNNDLSKPVTMIDGISLLRSCIENGIGFTYEPKFSKEILKSFFENDIEEKIEVVQVTDEAEIVKQNLIEKDITENDIRARIISVPSKIANELEDKKEYYIVFENDKFTSKFIKGRNYFSSGFTNEYRKHGLLSEDNVIISRKALWYRDKNIINIRLK